MQGDETQGNKTQGDEAGAKAEGRASANDSEASGAGAGEAEAESQATDEGENGAPEIGEAPPRDACANCGSPLVGPYCAQCGQRAADRIVPMSEMTREWVEDLFEFDVRIFRTLPTFFFKPGRLTKEYVRGRRVRYVRPLRLYLVASFILFTLLAFSDLATVQTSDSSDDAPGPLTMSVDGAGESASSAEADAATDSVSDAAPASAVPEAAAEGSTDSAQDAASPSPASAPAGPSDQSNASTLDPAALQQLRKLKDLEALSEADRAEIDSITQSVLQQASSSGANVNEAVAEAERAAAEGAKTSERSELAKSVTQDMNVTVSLFDDPERNAEAEAFIKKRLGQTIENPNAFVRAMIDRAPYVMFLLLPIFALLLKLLYIRRAKLYVQHLIFALHIHALAFFVFAAATGFLITESATLHTIGGWMTLIPFVYLYIALHHVYEQGWGKTALKTFLLLSIYNTVLLISLVGLAIASFLLM